MTFRKGTKKSFEEGTNLNQDNKKAQDWLQSVGITVNESGGASDRKGWLGGESDSDSSSLSSSFEDDLDLGRDIKGEVSTLLLRLVLPSLPSLALSPPFS